MAKPVVDGLEADLEGQAEVVRLSVLSDVGGTLARRYGVRGVPTLVVFDGAGEVIYSAAGIPDREAITAAVEAAAAR
jgi:thioredoxin-related protein